MADRTPITQLKGIGEKTAKLFAKIGIYTVEDLLVYYPRDYETFKEALTIAQAPTGSVNAVLLTGTLELNRQRERLDIPFLEI